MTGCERSNVATTSGKRPRTISNLTQEQIQHKRNVDRKAQRAFRQRTKDCIKNLEQEFAQLQETCTHKDQELQAVREHNETLVHCLENILELVSATLRQSRHVDNDGPGFESLGSGQENESEQPDPEPSSAARQLRPRTPDVEELPSEPITTAATPAETPQSQLGSAFGALPTPCSTLMPMASHLIVPTSVSVVIPSHLPPTCPLDKILLDFKASRRDLLAEGMAPDILAGPPRPTMKALIDSELVDSVHPLSGIMSQVLSTFPYVHMTEKLAFFYLMYHTTRWQIEPTKESYSLMPVWLRPTATQVSVPHAAWIDNIPWPGVRDILIENPKEYSFDQFSDYYNQSVSVNWPFEAFDAISDSDGVLHSIFEKHICRLKNWTVSVEFQSRFPDMMTAIYGTD